MKPLCEIDEMNKKKELPGIGGQHLKKCNCTEHYSAYAENDNPALVDKGLGLYS